jgi:hypothetical protein
MRILHPKGRSDRYFSKLGLDVRLTLVVFYLSLDYSWFRWRFSFEAVNTPVVTSSDRGLFWGQDTESVNWVIGRLQDLADQV